MRLALPKLSDEAIVPGLIFVALAVLAFLTPAQNDTWWHLRSGQEMWDTKSLLLTERFSHTAHGAPLQNHWWLSQLAFFALWSTGGPFLLTAFAGACAVASIFLSWRLLRGPWELRIVLLLWLMVATAPEWSVRPQVISLVLLAAVAHLVARDRLVWLPLVCVAWANAHALVVFGVAMAGASLMEAVVWSRSELKRAAAVALACVAAPLVSPLGWNYWPQVLSTVGTSRALQIQEYRFPSSPEDLPFWLAAGLLVVLVFMERHSLAQRSRADRTLLIGSLVLAVASMGASRNIAFFAVVAAPAISRLWPMPKTVRRSAAPRTIHAGAFAVALAVAGLVGATVVSVRWRDAGASLGWQPMSAATVKAISLCPDPLFNEMQDGGPLMWNLPGRRVFVDSRMEAYPVDLLRSSRSVDLGGDHATLFARYGFNCAITTTGSRLHDRLAHDPSLVSVHSDSGHTVFVRRGERQSARNF